MMIKVLYSVFNGIANTEGFFPQKIGHICIQKKPVLFLNGETKSRNGRCIYILQKLFFMHLFNFLLISYYLISFLNNDRKGRLKVKSVQYPCSWRNIWNELKEVFYIFPWSAKGLFKYKIFEEYAVVFICLVYERYIVEVVMSLRRFWITLRVDKNKVSKVLQAIKIGNLTIRYDCYFPF